MGRKGSKAPGREVTRPNARSVPRPASEMLGSRGNAEWLDLSDFVVHLAKPNDRVGYQVMMSVLWARRLLRGPEPFGVARGAAPDPDSQRAVCFSEVPLGFLDRLVERRGTSYGIGFSKRFVTSRGGAPLWYLEFGTPQHKTVKRMVAAAKRGGDADDPIWSLTPFIDIPSGEVAPYRYDFRWEREWRIAADVSFKESDVAFLLLPEALHGAAGGFFHDAVRENTGPGYFCPYIDPTWSIDRMRAALGAPSP